MLSSISLNTKQLEYLLLHKLDLNTYFVLEKCSENIAVDDLIKEFARVRNWVVLLQQARYLNTAREVTPSGEKILKEMAALAFHQDARQTTPTTEFQLFVEEFRDVFPEVKLKSGKNFRSNKRDLAKVLHYFMRHYTYTTEVILEAARRYVDHAEASRYEFIRAAASFVYRKDLGSELADWCDKVLAEDEEPKGTYTGPVFL